MDTSCLPVASSLTSNRSPRKASTSSSTEEPLQSGENKSATFPTLSPTWETPDFNFCDPLPPLSEDEDDLPDIAKMLSQTQPRRTPMHSSSSKKRQVLVKEEERNSESEGENGRGDIDEGLEEGHVEGARGNIPFLYEQHDGDDEISDESQEDQLELTPIAPHHPPRRPVPITSRRRSPVLGTQASPIEILSSAPPSPMPKVETRHSPPLPPLPKARRKISGVENTKLGQSSVKRARSPSNPPAPSPSPKRAKRLGPRSRKHDTHWHLDGSLLVQVKNTRFNLHRSRLVKMSDWFREKFEAGITPQNAEGVFRDGMDMVISLDPIGLSKQDFENLLDAFDDAITYYNDPPSFTTVVSIFRASTVLRVSTFESWAKKIILETWSNNLADLTPDRIPHATETVLLARQFNLPSVLRRAFYELLRHKTLGELTDDADSVIVNSSSSTPLLSAKDYAVLSGARCNLNERWIREAMTVSPQFSHCLAYSSTSTDRDNVSSSSSTMTSVVRCTTNDRAAARDAHYQLVCESEMINDYANDVLCGFQALMDAPWADKGFCPECVKHRRVVWGNTMERLWTVECDIWFGLKK